MARKPKADTKKKSAKATNAEVTRRTNQVITMLTKGAGRTEICQFASEKWDIDERTADRYIARANKYFAETSVINRDEQIGIALSRYNYLYQKNLNIDDYKAALATQKEIVNLLGLGAAKRTELDIQDWRSRAVADIRNGDITYPALAEAFDEDLATELFRAAGVSVSTG